MAGKPTINKIEAAKLNYFEAAAFYGVPADQVRRFAAAGYVAQEKQLQFHAAARSCDNPDGPSQVGFGGARGPGKSHALFAQIAIDDCQRFDGLKVLYLRKVAKNAREQFEDLRRAVLRFIPHKYQAHLGIISFPNGSRILIGHFKNESDVDSYLGLEYDIICIEEATTLTEAKYKTLRDSNRTSKEGFRPRIYASTNPGGVGHGWFKKRFIAPAQGKKEKKTRFIFSTVDDNAFIDEGYTEKLDENTGWKLKAYRHGDWDIAAGQFFTTFSSQIHVKKPDEIPVNRTAEFWCALDYGWGHYTVCYLLMKYDGVIYVLAEHGDRKQPVSYHATAIKEMLARFGLTFYDLRCFVAGSDVFAQRGAKNGETISDQYAAEGIFLTEANTDRINGAAQILKLLGDRDRKVESKFFISSVCVRLAQCLPEMQHDPNRPEDVLKVDIDDDGNGGDDWYDGVRYGVMADTSAGVWI